MKAGGAHFERVVIIDSIYKTNYSTTDSGHYQHEDGSQYAIKYYRTSAAGEHDPVLSTFCKKHLPAGVLNLLGGFTASLLVHAELYGLSAAAFSVVVDSHYVSAETLQGFAPIVYEVLNLRDVQMENIA